VAEDWINVLCKHHKDWVTIVKSFGEYLYAEDIVQEMYLRIARLKKQEKCVINGKPNKAYIYLILKNSHIDLTKYRQKNIKVSLYEIDNLTVEDYEQTMFTSYDKIEDKIYSEIDSWIEYDKRLFSLYLKGDISMREISAGTNISLTSIFNTIKNCKEKIRIKCGEDYEDYLNEEYNLIK
jgi:RNA polymerase sigma factor (sigma-70 family)